VPRVILLAGPDAGRRRVVVTAFDRYFDAHRRSDDPFEVVGPDARRFMQREQDALALIGLEVEDLSVQVDEPAPQRLSHEGHTFAGGSRRHRR
jgi:hypothetical protein